MLSKFFELLYNKVFVNIVVNKHAVVVEIDTYTKKGSIDSVEESFETSDINEKMISFIKSYIAETPYYYISVLDISTQQGVIPSCDKTKLANYHDLGDSKYQCFEKKWTYYTSKADLYAIEKTYEKIGIDFIFSPFSVVAHFFHEKIQENMALFTLVQDNFLALCVFENGELIFGQYLDMENTQEHEDLLLDSVEEENDLDFDLEDGIDLEDVDVIDDLESDEDFGDIEDLDSIEDIDEFSQTQDVEEEFYQESEEEIKENASSDGFNEDYQRFSLIQSAVNYFYKDTRYDSKFIESIYIADAAGVSPDLKTYLEEEMFLNVYIRQIDLPFEISSLAQEEVL